MLGKNVSNYFLQKLFAIIEDGIKLKLIRYNKTLQKAININLMNYIRFSGKYIIYEKNKEGKKYDRNKKIKGKEYDVYTNELIYEGEYLKGKKNGKGKGKEGKETIFLKNEAHYNYKITYEGEYLNGKKNGKGKEIIDGENILFEGEYKNGKRWNGKGYNTDGILIYELKDGKGYVRDYYHGFLIFEGEYLNGEKNGKGKEFDIIGNLIFDGEYLNGKRNGKGKEYEHFYLVFDGNYKYGRRWNGKLYTKNDQIVYELINGKGLFLESVSTLEYFEGYYKNGLRNGIGKIYGKTRGNLLYEGEYSHGMKNGKGKEYNDNGGLIFEGIYKYDHKFMGKEYYNTGKIKYEGKYLYDSKWTGKEYDQNSNIINEFKNGSGFIKEIDITGKKIYEGEYLSGKRNGKGKEYTYNFSPCYTFPQIL